MNISRNVESICTTDVSANEGLKSNTKSYAKLVGLEQQIGREGEYDVKLVSENSLEVRRKGKSGYQFKLEVTASDRTLIFQMRLPLDFKSESKEVLSVLNQLNDYSRENNHSEFWVMGYMGIVYLYSILIDDGCFDLMSDVAIYLVSDILEFAEYGLDRLSSVLQSEYVPSSMECTEMYR
ncbi:MAG: hypothetical protein II855_04505 [Candidatus Methanomethylophilaceae archaeon]|nr:hypothetical protein [Candidatus Methanomethylophilaceae archaeon]